MALNREIKPASWLIVLLAVLPGLLILLTHRINPQLAALDPIAWYLYLGLLVIGVPFIWWRKKRFPVWALLPLGSLIWSLINAAGMELSELANTRQILMPNRIGMPAGIALLNIVVITVIAAGVLRGQRLPRSAWILGGFMIVGNLLLAVLYSLEELGTERLFTGIVQYFATSGIGSLEGLMLVAIGLLFARQHGVLAMLVVIGGYSYIFLDSDYLFGYPQREWAWLATYFAGITILYLVVVPLALLRARTRLGRALAVFLPLVIFHGLRITVPLLVIQEPIRVLPGEVVWVINILLSFVLAWVVYNVVEEIQEGAEVESSVLPASLAN